MPPPPDDPRHLYAPGTRTYSLRKIPKAVWETLNTRCEEENLPRRAIILKALRRYLGMPDAGDDDE